MWYIFPQLKGLGSYYTAAHYAIDSLAEAEAYLQHPILGCRLFEICEELLKLSTNDANVVFGYPDELKLRSSLTLFEAAADQETIFTQVLAKDAFFAVTVRHVGDRVGETTDANYILPSYTLVNLAASVDLSQQLSLKFDVNNLFNEAYIENSYHKLWNLPGSPVNYSVSVKYQF